jgi:hypothetical protein
MLAGWKGSRKACETYILAMSVLDKQALPAPNPPVAVSLQE